MKLFDKTWKLAVSGAVIGLLVMLLAIYGNPANMAICVACFIRDTAGALKLHTAAPVQYFRPEVVGFVCGSFLLALLTKEYKSTAGSSPMVRCDDDRRPRVPRLSAPHGTSHGRR